MNSISEFQHFIKQHDQLHIGTESDNTAPCLNISGYSGVVEYLPEELVITLRAGTTIRQVNAILGDQNQALIFQIKDLDQTIGEVFSCSGAQFSDSVLGVQIINGNGEVMNFGGRVLKNVAGYDVSRMLVGSQGKLALITEVSLKVLPKKFALEFYEGISESGKRSELDKRLFDGLKKIFDPKGVFV